MNSRVGQTAALLAILAMVAIPTVASAANPVPCEKALGDLKTAISGATLSDADKATVTDLEGKGLERCKADDDAGADAFFSEAMKLVAK